MPNIDLTAEKWYEGLALPGQHLCEVETPDGKSLCVRSKNHNGPHRNVREWVTIKRCRHVSMQGFSCVKPERHTGYHIGGGQDIHGNWVTNVWT